MVVVMRQVSHEFGMSPCGSPQVDNASDDVLWNRVERCVDAIPESEQRWRPSYLMKAKMHTWLAWQEEPGAPIGLALTRRYLDGDAEQVQPLLAWIRKLFEL
jgi:hypothetical protein